MIIEKYFAIKLENGKYLDAEHNEETLEPVPIPLFSDAKRFCPCDGSIEKIVVTYEQVWCPKDN